MALLITVLLAELYSTAKATETSGPAPVLPGTQFITGSCSADSDCGSTCCEADQNVCRAFLSLSGEEKCKDGRAPGQQVILAPGAQFITGPCSADIDCASRCCENNANICRAFLSLSGGETCKDGRAPGQPESVTPGSQFITGSCSADADCASTCCENNQNVCRAFLSLSNGEACKDGRAPGQTGPSAPGSQFITGPCSADSDCASTCCERSQGICRAFLSLNAGEACNDGRAPGQTGFVAPGTQFITGDCSADADCASTCCETNQNVCRAFLSLNNGETCKDGRAPGQPVSIASGNQFITGPCSADADCASTCCETTQNVCRAFLSLSGDEACKDGRAPGQFAYITPGSQFITGPCSADIDCASTCCENSTDVCRAFLSLSSNETCKDGRTPSQPGAVAQGNQFITGPCSADANCASTCCERNQEVCRAFLSLNEGEACKDGRNPRFTVVVSNPDVATGNVEPGTQFITGPCSADADCASACCETNQNICRAFFSLSLGQTCKDGRAPNQAGSIAPGTQFITGVCAADADCASGCCVGVCRSFLSLSAGETCQDGRAPGQAGSVAPGTQFITGSCSADADCASTCCENNQNVCRAFLSLNNGETCKDGRAPGQAGPSAPGAQFITGPCSADADCASTCCEINQNICRAFLSLSSGQTCKDGRAPGQAGFVAPGSQFITGPCTSDADCASTCCETNQNICRAFLSLSSGQTCKDGRAPGQPVSIASGNQFINGPCSADADCASTCCENTQNVCRAFLALSGDEACKDGRSPGVWSYVTPGSQFITGPCSADSDCASTCCENNQNVCRAFLSLSSSETCKDGRTPSQQAVAQGSQFITGPCAADADCASSCCERSQGICRAFLSLNVGEACKDGRNPRSSVFVFGSSSVDIEENETLSVSRASSIDKEFCGGLLISFLVVALSLLSTSTQILIV